MELKKTALALLCLCSSCLFVYSSAEDGQGGNEAGAPAGGGGEGAGGGGGHSPLTQLPLSARGFALAAGEAGVAVLTGLRAPDRVELLPTGGDKLVLPAREPLTPSLAWSGQQVLAPKQEGERSTSPIVSCDLEQCGDWQARGLSNVSYVAVGRLGEQVIALRSEGGLDVLEADGALAQHLVSTGTGLAAASGRCLGEPRLAWTSQTSATAGTVWVADKEGNSFKTPLPISVDLVPGSVTVSNDCKVYFAASDSASTTYYRLESESASPTPLGFPGGPLPAVIAAGDTRLFAAIETEGSSFRVIACDLTDLTVCDSAAVECNTIGGVVPVADGAWFVCDDQLVRWTLP